MVEACSPSPKQAARDSLGVPEGLYKVFRDTMQKRDKAVAQKMISLCTADTLSERSVGPLLAAAMLSDVSSLNRLNKL
jgi:hypothetical protein